MNQPTETPLAPPDPVPEAPQLRRSSGNKVIGGVCGGLGRYCDLDPVIFRIALGVLSVTGGLGLVFYGFAWLLVPLEGEDESEARRLLTGRVEGASLVAVLMALAGCGIFLTMLNDGGVMTFGVLLTLLLAGAAVWSQRRSTAPADVPLDPVAAQAVADAPPETKAPPAPSPPSWWRDPIVKDGTGGPGGGYLWGPADAAAAPAPTARKAVKAAVREIRGPRSIGGLLFLAALLAFGAGFGGTWRHQPLGTGLEIGFAAALGVFGLGLVLSSLLGRTGSGTIFLAVLTAALLAGSAALPKSIDSHWVRTGWTPAAIGEVRPDYRLGTGVATLDLSRIAVPPGRTLTTRAEVGAGKARVVVPKDVTVNLTIDVGVGDIQLPSERPGDIHVSPDQKRTTTLPPPAGTKPAGTLQLELKVGVGQAEVDRAAS
ncbi:PspC domain-containing protein [Streptomyces sp. NPDC050485]|uniref:PspC domain-containing protein n=1 Tax=Streptomyces sp. NPDC050485 TaxID=3365617 RepID=UPI00379F3FC8